MWRNYLTVGFRALTRSRTYAFINIFGLATGLAACLMLMLYVRYETSYDRWLPDAERIYQVQSISTAEENVGAVAQQGRRRHRPFGHQAARRNALAHQGPNRP